MLKDIIFLGLWFCGLAYLVIGFLIEHEVITFEWWWARKAKRILKKDRF